MINSDPSKCLLILCTTTGYQTRAFVDASEKLGLSVVFGSDRCHVLEDPWQDGALPLRFEDPEASAIQIALYAQVSRVDAIVVLGDRPTRTAARALKALALPGHSVKATDDCRDKYRSRERLRAEGLNVPPFTRLPLDCDPRNEMNRIGGAIRFPCVLKPLALSGSRGVIRANDDAEFATAFERIRKLLRSPDVQVMREETSGFIQVESYVEGEEIAIEGVISRGELRVLAIFDKCDPLVGPYFEETIYVTPSRLEPNMQHHAELTLQRAVRTLGLSHGPLHAEIRLNKEGAWILEVAARSIGGLCSRALRFHSPSGDKSVSLEELIIRLALGEDVSQFRREEAASGVMMIPIPEAGILEQVDGVDGALETPGVEEIRITVKPNERLIPLPEGSSYLGFIFARGASGLFVENALRQAHGKLRFIIQPALPVLGLGG